MSIVWKLDDHRLSTSMVKWLIHVNSWFPSHWMLTFVWIDWRELSFMWIATVELPDVESGDDDDDDDDDNEASCSVFVDHGRSFL